MTEVIDMDYLTEEKAAYLFARAWNRLNPEGFLALLAPEARYASQWVFEELVGASAIAAYLRGKMATVRDKARKDPSAAVRVERGKTAEGRRGRPCAFMTQGLFEKCRPRWFLRSRVTGSFATTSASHSCSGL
jgi:hypothetical protein